MIGNDVVDLAAAKKDSNWKRKSFLQKLFSEEERQAIMSYPEPETMVWVLWSMKEAAYKIYNRETGVRAYIPHRLHCTVTASGIHSFTGAVSIGNYKYYTETTIVGDAIHTVALTELYGRFHEPQDPAIIKDASGVPYMQKENELYPVSISHHGRYRKVVCPV